MSQRLKQIQNEDSVDILKILNERKLFIIASVVFIIVSTFIVTAVFVKPTYQVTAKVMVQKERLDESNLLPIYEQDGSFIKNQAEIISSRPIIENAIENLKEQGKISKAKQISPKQISKIQEKISVDVLRNTSVIEFKFQHKDQELIADLANEITKSYILAHNRNKEKVVSEALTAVNEQVQKAYAEIDQAEKSTAKYLIDNSVGVLPESELVLDLKRFADFDLEVAKVGSELKSVNTKLESLYEAVQDNSPSDINLPFLVNSQTLKDYNEKIQLAKVKLADLKQKYTSQHPDIVATRAIIKQLELDRADERVRLINAEIESINIEKKLVESRMQVLLEEKTAQSKHLNKVLASQPELSGLMQTVKLKRRIYEDLLEQQRNLEIFSQRVRRSEDLVVLEPASMPAEPYSPSMKVNLFLGALCGLTFGCGIAIILPHESKKEQISPVIDERKAKRFACSNKVTYTVAGDKAGPRTSYSKDISSNGMSIVGEKILKKNDKVKFNIENPNKDPIKGNGIVIWSSPAFRKGETGGYVAGIKFEDLDLNISDSES